MAGNLSPLDDLTDRQREVLELLSQHKTSKEIARELGISHYTVDQHIESAAAKLGTGNRRELALAYRRLKLAPEGLGTEEFGMAKTPNLTEPNGRADEVIDATRGPLPAMAKQDYRVVPEMFEGPYRTWARLAAIVLAALVLLFVALAGMAVFTEASRFVSDFL